RDRPGSADPSGARAGTGGARGRAGTLLQDPRGERRDEPAPAVRDAAGVGRPGRGAAHAGAGGRGRRRLSMRLGYNTIGFAHHRLADALEVIDETGYRGVALSPDVHHLAPFDSSPAAVAAVRRQLERLDLAPVVETGAR